jgi:hypothetical protein
MHHGRLIGARPLAGRRIRRVIAVAVLGAVMSTVVGVEMALAGKPKPLASGLITVGVRPSEWPGLIDAYVPTVEWRALQPRPRMLNPKPIDDMIRRARMTGDSLRIRIFAGRGAPDWVKRRYGTVFVRDPYDGVNAVVPRWWNPGYMDAYRRLQWRLARRYDGNPTIRSVTVSGAMTIYAEPFIRGIGSYDTRRNLLRAGYTAWKDKRAMMRSIDAQRPWKRTRQIMAFNPWQFVRGDGTFGSDTGFTNKVMSRFRNVFGRRAILQNNSIRSSWIGGRMPYGYAAMYAKMRKLGRPLSYQTAQTFRVGDLGMVLNWAVNQGAHAVELQSGAQSKLSYWRARQLDTMLQRNAR